MIDRLCNSSGGGSGINGQIAETKRMTAVATMLDAVAISETKRLLDAVATAKTKRLLATTAKAETKWMKLGMKIIYKCWHCGKSFSADTPTD